ncbi:13436_t:CDS:2, partial [Funneliformis caledonium]
MAQSYAELLEVILAKGYGLTKFFGKINFPFSEKQQAEKILSEALKIIVTEGGEQASKAFYILDKFDAHINSNDVKSFWEDVRLQNEQVKTRSNQLILTEKKKQQFIQVESNIVEQHFIASDKLLSEHMEYISTAEDSNQEDVKNDYGKQDDNANNKEVVEEMQNTDYENFTERYQNMDNDRKWKLTTGKIVEDSLYEFGMRCKYEHLCHSFIVDPNDYNYIVESVFTLEELNEIKEYKYKKLPNMPTDLLRYLNSFRKYNTRDLRKAVFETQSWNMPFNRDTHFDFDWVRNSIYNLGESCSVASSARKNMNRMVSAIVSIKRKVMGRRADFLIRYISTEYACSEVGKIFDGENGTKLLKERGKKTPKMMKDIFDNLCMAVGMKEEKIRKLQSVGFVHANLMVVLLRMDSPEGFVCRVNRTRMIGIPAKVEEFGSKAIHVIMLAWKAKMVVRNMIDLVEQNDAIELNEEEELEELQNCCESPQHRLQLPIDSKTPPSPKRDTMYLPHCSKTPQKRIKITNAK